MPPLISLQTPRLLEAAGTEALSTSVSVPMRVAGPHPYNEMATMLPEFASLTHRDHNELKRTTRLHNLRARPTCTKRALDEDRTCSSSCR